MPICVKCGTKFPFWVIIDGKHRNLASRKRCLKCSPFGFRNTGKTARVGYTYQCACGETDPSKFRAGKRNKCKKCVNQYLIERGRKNKQRARKLMGGKCWHCGYEKYQVALGFHHLNPSEKDTAFHCSRFWKWVRLLAEIKKCALLCANCHSAVHTGIKLDFPYKPRTW